MSEKEGLVVRKSVEVEVLAVVLYPLICSHQWVHFIACVLWIYPIHR